MLLVSGATRTTARFASNDHLGTLIVPGNGNKPTGKPWACDNGAFSGFREDAFLKMLDRVSEFQGCLWVAAPDVPYNAAATLDLFNRWEPLIRERGFPVALVAQDVLTIASTPWERLECLFVGGGDAFKLGPEARELVAEAKRRGKLVHMGRVNTETRLRYAFEIGCDSVDGSAWTKWSDRWLGWGLRKLDRIESQGLLFGRGGSK